MEPAPSATARIRDRSMIILGKDITPARLGAYAATKRSHLSKRAIVLRKPAMCARHPFEWVSRKRSRRALGLPENLLAASRTLGDVGHLPTGEFIDPSLLSELRGVAQNRLEDSGALGEATDQRSKKFWHQLLKPEDFDVDGIFMRYAMQQPILQIIAELFGQIPQLTIAELALSVFTPQPEGPLKSQRWHQDLGDDKTLKLFTYLTDVESDDDGPLNFIPRSVCSSAPVPYFPVHKTDEQLEPLGILESKKALYGPQGSSFLIDTHNCLHAGSRFAPGHRRLVFILTYNTFCSWQAYENKIFARRPLTGLEQLVFRPASQQNGS